MPEERMHRSSRGMFAVVIIIVVLIAGLVWTAMSYKKAKDEVHLLSTAAGQQQLAAKEVDAIVDKVKTHIVLPDEVPMVATVADVESLARDQAFFVGAKNGDRLLIYSNKAILYNEKDDILVNVGPVFVDGAQQPAPVVPEVVEPVVEKKGVSVEVRNGSKTTGVASARAGDLESKGYTIGDINNASNNEYTENILVNLTGKDVNELEQLFGVIAVTELPEGESTTGSDVLIILGS